MSHRRTDRKQTFGGGDAAATVGSFHTHALAVQAPPGGLSSVRSGRGQILEKCINRPHGALLLARIHRNKHRCVRHPRVAERSDATLETLLTLS